MQALQALAAECKRTEKNKTFQTVDVYKGVARFLRPNMASLEMEREDKPGVPVEKFICSGTFIYQFLFQQKEVRVHELPKPKQGQIADDGFLAFLFGMKAAEARERYDLRLVKEDQWYVYVEILPRTNADKAEFQKARLVLNKDNYLPRQFWFEQPNGDEVTWDIGPHVDTNPKLNRRDFEPTTPQGWKMVTVPRAASDVPPRVVRPQQ